MLRSGTAPLLCEVHHIEQPRSDAALPQGETTLWIGRRQCTGAGQNVLLLGCAVVPAATPGMRIPTLATQPYHPAK